LGALKVWQWLPTLFLTSNGLWPRISRIQAKNPQKIVTIAALAIVLPVLVILWIGNRDHAYKVQMATIFVVLGVCAIGLIPLALKAKKSDDL
jgi:hypothetical protein